MIKVIDTTYIDNTHICNGCGNLTDKLIKIKDENATYLNLCSTCRIALRDKLTVPSQPSEFEYVRLVLERELVILKADLKSLGEVLLKDNTLPLIEEKLRESITPLCP